MVLIQREYSVLEYLSAAGMLACASFITYCFIFIACIVMLVAIVCKTYVANKA